MSVLISTGNVSHARQSHAADLVLDLQARIHGWHHHHQQQLQQQQQHLEDQNGDNWLNQHAKIIIPPNPDEPLFGSVQADVDITVKLFFPPNFGKSSRIPRQELLSSAIESLRDVFNSNSSSNSSSGSVSLVLSFPEITFSDNDGDEDDNEEEQDADEDNSKNIQEVLHLYAEAVNLGRKVGIAQFGVSEFSTKRLRALIRYSKQESIDAPSIDQINLQDCCVLPPSLLKLAHENNIKLLAHNDPINIFPDASVRHTLELIKGDKLVEHEASGWKWAWLLRINGVISNRGIVDGLGWIVKYVNLDSI
ncbi:hypothetical protein V1514DRAFT_331136 [Lipomyces japonicus]|uniref:uncharacterized protein n=1 Tax=Lipomyces japonicus TaxID=56871 RepID=UPI0034CE727A